MAKNFSGQGIQNPGWLAWIPMFTTLFITIYGLNSPDVNWDFDKAWQILKKNPMFGGDVPVKEPLPLWTYTTGHWLVGLIPITVIVLSVMLIYREWRFTSGPREDLRGHFEGFVSLLGSAPIVALTWKFFLEGNFGKFYWDINDHSYLYLFCSASLQLACLETWFYWAHRAAHWKPIYKAIHSVHHSYVPTISSCAAAFHPLDMGLLTMGCFIGPAVIPQYYPMTHAILLVQMIWTVVAHVPCRADFRWMTFGYGIISDPNLHNIHHDYGIKCANMGSMFCLWDHVGGTYYPDPPVWADVTPAHQQYADHQKRRTASRPEHRDFDSRPAAKGYAPEPDKLKGS